jgi:hypothetical protein
MSALHRLAEGGFAFLEGVFSYSQGAVALDGYAIERACFARPLPVAEGFRRIATHLQGLGRPKTALCACELRSPRPFSFAGFGEFNRGYVAVLQQWGLFRDRQNAVARSNVAPEINPPAEPSFYAFSYTVPMAHAGRSFVVPAVATGPGAPDIIARAATLLGRAFAKDSRCWTVTRLTGLGGRLRRGERCRCTPCDASR